MRAGDVVELSDAAAPALAPFEVAAGEGAAGVGRGPGGCNACCCGCEVVVEVDGFGRFEQLEAVPNDAGVSAVNEDGLHARRWAHGFEECLRNVRSAGRVVGTRPHARLDCIQGGQLVERPRAISAANS